VLFTGCLVLVCYWFVIGVCLFIFVMFGNLFVLMVEAYDNLKSNIVKPDIAQPEVHVK
jgi:hypothetical protein